jgi:arylsulfatase A-like enzyme
MAAALMAVGLGTAGASLSFADETPLAAVVAASEGAAASAGAETGEAADMRPDIFAFMLDDHAFLEDERVLSRLPNIRDAFLEDGLRLTQMHTETPLCGPARASLLSGQHTFRHGITGNVGDALDQDDTLAVALDEAGYHTAMVGKYLNGWTGTTTPPGWDEMAMAKGSYRSVYWRNGELVDYRPLHVDEANRQQVVELTRDAPLDEPMFLLASVRAPHADQCVNDDEECHEPRVIKADRGAEVCAAIELFRPPSYTLEDGRGREIWSMPDWPDGWRLTPVCESLLVIDRMVGEAMAAQAERGRPAYFLFFSDNGMSWGQHGVPFKAVPWSTRMPFYVAGPGIEPGEADELLSIIDVPVTIADIAGADMPWADGESFRPLLEGGEAGRDELLEVMGGRFRGLRTPEWHYVRWGAGDWGPPESQLFAYREDPWHMDDRLDDEPEIAAALDARLDELIEASRS